METLKWRLTLLEDPLAVPDTGRFVNSNPSASYSILAVLMIIAILAVVTYLVVKNIRKNRRLSLVPIVIICVLFGVVGILASSGSAVDDYISIEATQELVIGGEIKDSAFFSGKATVTSLEKTWGYTLYSSAENASFVPKDEANKTEITSISEPGALSANTYGITLEAGAKAEDEVWYPLSDTADIIKAYSKITYADNVTDIYFGVLVDDSVEPDTYELGVDFYAVENAASISRMNYMQDFKALSATEKGLVFESMAPNQQYTLEDKRDNKEYYIAKLADGNVWMTENLGLDLNSQVALTSNDTDLNLYGSKNYVAGTSEYEDKDSQYVSIDNGYACSNESETCEDGVISWTPTRSTLSNPEEWVNWDALSYSYKTTGDCAVSVEGCNDGHSYANNYYNWAATVASNNMDYSKDGDGNPVDAANSICPAGWRLPSDINHDFSKLFFAYGIAINDSGDAGYKDENGYNKMISSPLYFTEAGNIQHTSRDFLGDYGYYWTSTSASWSRGVHMRFFDGTMVPGLKDTNKRFGFSVRCLVR